MELLFGRQEEVSKLVETLNTPGQHVLLYGERGVGKSSLANVVSEVLLHAVQPAIFVKRCDRSDNFESIIQKPLRAVGADHLLQQVSSSRAISNKDSLKLGFAEIGNEESQDLVHTYTVSNVISPSTAAESLHELDGLLVVDEFDAIASDEDRSKVAELIKHLSDSGSNLKLMVVGIAETGDQLTAAHPSVQRCLRETKLRRMGRAELEEIVIAGANALRLRFDTSVVESIVRLSAGYPHFTHLLALKCAEDAIGEGSFLIMPHDLSKAMDRAVSDAEGTLKRIYDDSVRAPSPMYRHILAAAASLDSDEFSANDVRNAVILRTGEDISQGSLNNYYKRLISTDGTTILRRAGRGFYRFEDPRMRSYIRLIERMV
ncbi:AAA family ATPase [Lentzea albida]|nr:ATP-binding protein [Lentzea albida]